MAHNIENMICIKVFGGFLWLAIVMFLSKPVIAQHLGIAQVLELMNVPFERRGVILEANHFTYQRQYVVDKTTCMRYARMQADINGDEYEETVTYCASGSLTYVTFSPDHATNLKFQLIRKFDFQDRGTVVSQMGLLKNLYQRRTLNVETANTKNSQGQDLWVFQIYHEEPIPTPPDTRLAEKKAEQQSETPSTLIPLKGNFYALIIAVNEYSDRQVQDLDFPIQDGIRLRKVLTEQYTFNERNITVLKNPTRRAILRTFDDLVYRLRKNDNLLIFFAGHGRQEEKSQQGYWLPADAANDYNDDWLSNSTIRDQLRRLSCQHVLVVSDACFSGELISTRGNAGPSKAIQQLYNLRSRRAITSSGSTVVPDRSVFIDYLVKRLMDNTKPYLTASELFVNMREAVINNSSLKQVPMYGYIQQAGDEGGDFIFMKRNP